jgi:hypothetical protein
MSRAVSAGGPDTVGEEIARIAPGKAWLDLTPWPPDVFAATSTLLAESGAYRSVVCPPDGASWPPTGADAGGSSWGSEVARVGREWAESVAATEATPAPSAAEPPEAIVKLCATLDAASDTPVMDLDEAAHWEVVSDLLSLHAMADEACVGAGLESETPLQRLALAELEGTGSLARLPSDRVRVLPKLRPPESGITLRSISHNLALDRSEVWPSWLRVPDPTSPTVDPHRGRLTMLLVPYPATVHANDFRPIRGPLMNMDPQRYGFFEYAPAERLQPEWILDLVDAARRHVGDIDAVVLPEAALDEPAVPELQEALAQARVPYLISGVRRRASSGGPFGANYAYIGGADWHAAQHKHHRWCLDAAQVHQYHLGAAIDPNHRWWEAIRVQRRTLNFVTTPGPSGLTICPLVCEDLARPDPVTDVVRAVAPTLVVGLLLDGPQLAERWPARYASVLADDPGCSVLTLTALGMAWRSQPSGFNPSRVIALWKDPHRGLQQITLADDAKAVALTAHRREISVTSADGRSSSQPVSELVLSGLEQIS